MYKLNNTILHACIINIYKIIYIYIYIYIYLLLHLLLFHVSLHPQPVPLLNHFSHLQTEVGGLLITAHFCGIVSVCVCHWVWVCVRPWTSVWDRKRESGSGPQSYILTKPLVGGCARRCSVHSISLTHFCGCARRCSIHRIACTCFFCGCAYRCSTCIVVCRYSLFGCARRCLNPPHCLILLLIRLSSQILELPSCLQLHMFSTISLHITLHKHPSCSDFNENKTSMKRTRVKCNDTHPKSYNDHKMSKSDKFKKLWTLQSK